MPESGTGSGHRYQRLGITSELRFRWISLSISALGTPGTEGAGRFPHPSSEGEGSTPRLLAEVSSTTYRGGHAGLGEEGNQPNAGPRARRLLSAGLRALRQLARATGTPRTVARGFRSTGRTRSWGRIRGQGAPGIMPDKHVRRFGSGRRCSLCPRGFAGAPPGGEPPGTTPTTAAGRGAKANAARSQVGRSRPTLGPSGLDLHGAVGATEPAPARAKIPAPTTAFEFSWHRSSGERAEAINDRPSAGSAGAGAGTAAGTRWRRGHAAPPRDAGERDGLRASLPPLGTHFWASISLDLALYLCSRPAASCSSRSRRSLSSRCRSSSALLFSSSRRFSSSF